jgi:DNA-binding transcriptional regulator YiaG
MLCAGCSQHELVEIDTDHRLRVAGFVFSAPLRARECPRCQLRHLDGVELERFDVAVARALALSSVLTSDALRFMREAIGATPGQIAAELDAPLSSVLKWESGRVAIPAEAMGRVARLVLLRTDRPDVPRVQMRELARATAVQVRGFKAASGD